MLESKESPALGNIENLHYLQFTYKIVVDSWQNLRFKNIYEAPLSPLYENNYRQSKNFRGTCI